MQRIETLTEAISDLMASVNQMRARRYNVIGVSWQLNYADLSASLPQPIGLVWFRVRIGNNGRRHIQRIPKVTLQRVKDSYQGRDSTTLKHLHLHQQIARLAEEWGYLIEVLVKVMRVTQHLNLKKPMKRKS